MQFQVKKTVLLFLTLIFAFYFNCSAQIEGQSGMRGTETSIDKKSEKINAKIKRKEDRAFEKERKKTLKKRYKMQSKEVQKRMKSSRKEADRFNSNIQGHESFLKRLFTKRRKR